MAISKGWAHDISPLLVEEVLSQHKINMEVLSAGIVKIDFHYDVYNQGNAQGELVITFIAKGK